MSKGPAHCPDGDSAWVGSSALAIGYAAAAVVPLYIVGASAGTIQSQIGITTSEFGYAISCYFATGALVSHRVGPMVDRMPLTRSIRIGMASSASASLLLAFTANTWLLLGIGLALCGTAHAFSQLATNRMLAGQISRRRALGFGLKQASIPVASLLAGFSTAALTPPASPTPLFLVAAVLASVLGVVAPRPRVSVGSSPKGDVPRVNRRPLVRLAVAAGLAAGAGNTLSVLVVDSLNERSFTDKTAALVLAWGSTAAVLARIVMGIMVDRRESDGRRELRAMLVAGAVSFVVLAMSSGSAGVSTVGAVLAFGTGWGWPGVVFFVASTQRSIAPAAGSGLILSGTMSGSILGPLIIATLAEHVGYGSGWLLAAAQLAVAAILVQPVNRRARRVETKRERNRRFDQ